MVIGFFSSQAAVPSRPCEPVDAYGSLELRVRRRLGSRGKADALVSKCRDRSITESVVASCTRAELMEELGISEEEASVLGADDAAWDALVQNADRCSVASSQNAPLALV